MPGRQKLQEKLDALVEKKAIPTGARIIISTIFFSTLLFGLILSYFYLQYGELTSRWISNATANAAVILIGLSFVMSSVCYFWNFADRLIIYRKHLGLAGFAFAAIHSYLAFTNLPFSFFVSEGNLIPFIGAVVALALYSIMALISNTYAVHELGGKRWRQILRYGGYIALLATMIHFGLKGYEKWFAWLTGNSEMLTPPMSLLMFVFAAFVLAMRLALWWSVLRRRSDALQPSTPPSQ